MTLSVKSEVQVDLEWVLLGLRESTCGESFVGNEAKCDTNYGSCDLNYGFPVAALSRE